MEQTLLTPADDGALETGIRDMLAQMKALRDEMERDQAEIERLKKETTMLKEEGAVLKASRGVMLEVSWLRG